MSIHDFSSAVIASSGSLRHFGMTPSGDGDEVAMFMSSTAALTVSYDRTLSHEVGIEIGRVGSSEIPFNLGEIFREYEIAASSFFQTSDQKLAVDFVKQSLEQLVSHAAPVLRGDEAAFQRLSTRRNFEARSYTTQMRLASIRPRAEDAWRAHNYLEFARLMEPVAQDLAATDLRKLSFARSHVSSSEETGKEK